MNRSAWLFASITIFMSSELHSQVAIRPVEQLISSDPAWPLVQDWIKAAKNKVQVLERDPEAGRKSLHQTQVTTRSPMGAIVYETGGILINDGLIRILGAGCPKLGRSLPSWNDGRCVVVSGRPTFLLIADDVFGGFYALNGGNWREHALGAVVYFSPRSLQWMTVAPSYTEFLNFAFQADLKAFYSDLLWTGCEAEIASIKTDGCINFYPPLWTLEGKDPAKASRRAVPVSESYVLQMDFAKQLR